MFRNQSVAMEASGLWTLPTYKGRSLVLLNGMLCMPQGETRKVKAGILNWGSSADTKNPDAVWDLLKFLSWSRGDAYCGREQHGSSCQYG